MKEGWKYERLDEIATEFYRGSGITRDQVRSEGTPCVRYGEIYTSYNIGFDKCKSFTDEAKIKSKKFFEHGDILFAITGESVEDIGKSIAYLGNDKCLAGGDIVVMKHNQNPKYLSYALSTKEAIRQKGAGKTKLKVVHTNVPSLKNISIPIPPLSEQQQIVDFLDAEFAKIDELKKQAEQSLQNAKDLFQAAIKEMLTPKQGWKTKTLAELSSIVGNYGLSVSSKPYNGVRYLRITDITEWGDLNEEKVSADIVDQTQEKLEDGDILFARTGATVGKTLIYKAEFGDCLFAGYLIRYRLKKDEILPSFMFYVTHSSPYYQWVQTNQKAAAQPNIGAKVYNGLEIYYPSLIEEQTDIVAKLDTIFHNFQQLQSNYTLTIQLCADLKQALLRQVFE